MKGEKKDQKMIVELLESRESLLVLASFQIKGGTTIEIEGGERTKGGLSEKEGGLCSA